MSAVRSINWSSLTSKLSPETVTALSAFRRRHTELQKTLQDLRDQDKQINFTQYRTQLSNSKVVDNAESSLKSFKPATFDIGEQVRVIESQHKVALQDANRAVSVVSNELIELKALASIMETVRPLADLNVEDIVKAVPQLEHDVQKMVIRSQWEMPGYSEKFGEFKLGF